MKLRSENLWLRRFLSLLLLAVLWEILSRTGVIDPFYAPAPTEILRVVFALFAEGTIFNHLQATFTAALVGLVVGLGIDSSLRADRQLLNKEERIQGGNRVVDFTG